MSPLDELKKRNTRRASALQVGGFRPTLDPLASHLGRTPVARPGEDWPHADGQPLLCVGQFNLRQAPAVPALLQDLALITFFVRADPAALGEQNGQHWCLRSYPTLEGLQPLAVPPAAPRLAKGFECAWEALDDHPCPEDPERVRISGARWPARGFDNQVRSKIGGYASLIQGEPWWALRDHPARPVFALQVNSEEKAGLAWGDGGTLYLARGSAPGAEADWFLDWQCF